MAAVSTRQRIASVALGAVAGIALVYSLGFTAAIAAPAGLFDRFRATGALDPGLALWHFVVVHGLGVGLPAFLVSFLAFRTAISPGLETALLFACGVLLVIHVVYPLAYGYPSAFLSRPWWGYGLELALVAAVSCAWLLARRSPGTFRPGRLRRST